MTSTIESVYLNHVQLYFSINPDSLHKPLLLYLHGGPGDSCIPLTQKFNASLEEHFNFINLEQRGAGLSYYKFSAHRPPRIAIFIEDIHLFVEYLLKRFHQERLILIGHSWGSVLGMLFIQRYPQLVAQYIGVGQVINMRHNLQLQAQFLKQRGVKLKKLDLKHNLIPDSLYLTKKIVQQQGSLYGKTNYSMLIKPFLTAKAYPLTALINRLRGSRQSIKFLWPELMQINFDNIQHYSVPVCFMEGRHDHHVAATLVQDYVHTLDQSVPLIWFEKSGHFPQWEQPQQFNQTITQLCL